MFFNCFCFRDELGFLNCDDMLLLFTHSLDPCLWWESDHPAAPSLLWGLSTNSWVTVWCVCGCSWRDVVSVGVAEGGILMMDVIWRQLCVSIIWGRKICLFWDALKARKSALVWFKTNITTVNLSNFRVARAKARRACRENKRASWQQYVSRLNIRTTLRSTWDMVRRISGKYKASAVSHLNYNDNDITDVKEICNTLAAHFAFNSSSDNYSHVFNRHRLTIERKTIDFYTNNHFYITMYLLCTS